VSALAGRSGISLLLYGGALLLAVVVGAGVAYSERYGGDNGPYILLGLLLAIAVAVAILLQWRLGALLLVAAIPFESAIDFGPVTSGTKALGFLTFVSLALALLRDQRLSERFVRLWQQPLAPTVGAFVLWVLLSILWAYDKGDALRTTVSFLGLLGLMVAIGLLEKRYLVLAWAGLAFSAALSVPGGYILPVPEGSDMAVSGRFGPAGTGPNSYSLNLAIAFFVAYFGVDDRTPPRPRLPLRHIRHRVTDGAGSARRHTPAGLFRTPIGSSVGLAYPARVRAGGRRYRGDSTGDSLGGREDVGTIHDSLRVPERRDLEWAVVQLAGGA
jgi:hypothetical protein